MKILSLFDGISCARVALDRVGIPVEAYYASEIDEYAMQVSAKNYPDIIQVGDIKDLNGSKFHGISLPRIDLLIGGSPCQDLSIAKKDRKGLDGDRSGLFWEYVRILKEVKPKFFILENVNSMPKEAKQLITETLGLEPIMINAGLVSGQQRKRLFWTNILNVTQSEDWEIFLKDVVEENVDEKYFLSKEACERAIENRKSKTFHTGKRRGPMVLDRLENGKALTLTTNCGSGENRANNIIRSNQNIKSGFRNLIPIECERLQGLPDNYTEGVSNSQRYKMLGNAFNVDVVAHILSFITPQITLTSNK